MKRLNEYEFQIDKVKHIGKIRHYTTGFALIEILESGILIANKSIGDKELKDIVLHNKTISFHDVRIDPEYSAIIKHNRKNERYLNTKTLGLHIQKICCCIEIDYDKLDKSIEDKTYFLNINGHNEVRIEADIELNKENCKIIIFKGLCNVTNQLQVIDTAEKYKEKYNIEII